MKKLTFIAGVFLAIFITTTIQANCETICGCSAKFTGRFRIVSDVSKCRWWENKVTFETGAGEQGPQGEVGPQGPAGPKGPKGDPGECENIRQSLIELQSVVQAEDTALHNRIEDMEVVHQEDINDLRGQIDKGSELSSAPEIGIMPSYLFRSPGSDWNHLYVVNGSYTSSECHVVQFCGYTYVPMTNSSNGFSMNIVAYDADYNIVQQTEKYGARYCEGITVDKASRTIIFKGQGGNVVSMKYATPWLLAP